MQKQNTIYNLVAVMIVLFVVAGGLLAYKLTEAPLVQINPPAPSLPAPPTVVPPRAYENEYMKVTVPAGWALTEATQTLQDQVYDKTTGKTKLVGKPVTSKTGAVNIVKGKYILYINPNAGQASGVTGGRFGEIAGGAPSADAVITEHPSPPCNNGESHPAFDSTMRQDLYVSSKDKVEWCAVPTNGKTVWYFSYITTAKNGYFNYYKAGEALAYVITMAYNSSDVNSLPVKGSPELTSALTEMTETLDTLELKQFAKQSR